MLWIMTNDLHITIINDTVDFFSSLSLLSFGCYDLFQAYRTLIRTLELHKCVDLQLYIFYLYLFLVLTNCIKIVVF